jgi:hypothetical protein
VTVPTLASATVLKVLVKTLARSVAIVAVVVEVPVVEVTVIAAQPLGQYTYSKIHTVINIFPATTRSKSVTAGVSRLAMANGPTRRLAKLKPPKSARMLPTMAMPGRPGMKSFRL